DGRPWLPPAARLVPSGLKLSSRTAYWGGLAGKVAASRRVVRSTTVTVPLFAPAASHRPSGLSASVRTGPWTGTGTSTAAPVIGSSRGTPSAVASATRLASGERATAVGSVPGIATPTGWPVVADHSRAPPPR